MKHTGIRVVAGVFVVILIVVAIAGGVAWFKIAALKSQLAQGLGDALGAKVEVASLGLNLWDGEIRAAGITLTNQRPDAPWDHGDISQATVHFHLHDLLAKTMPLSVEVSSWNVILRPNPAGGGSTGTASSGTEVNTTSGESPATRRFQVTQLSAVEGEVEVDLAADRKVLIHGVSFDSADNGAQVWTTHLQATSITAGSLELGASSVDLRADSEQITCSNLRMQCTQGMITGDGDRALGGAHETHLALKAADVPITMLVSVPWQVKLSGLTTGSLIYHGDDTASDAHGQLAVTGGKFNVLPFLGKMTLFLGMPDLTGVELDRATSDFAWKDGTMHLTNIDVRKNDMLRVTGQVDVDASNQVDGHLKLGLPASILAKWPQLQTAVFPNAVEDYSWADVHLTGTPDHLQEDLSSRILAAGIQSGGSLINQGTQKAMDLWKSFMGP